MKLQKLLKKLALPVFALVVVSMLAACSSPSGGDSGSNGGGGGNGNDYTPPALEGDKEYDISLGSLSTEEQAAIKKAIEAAGGTAGETMTGADIEAAKEALSEAGYTYTEKNGTITIIEEPAPSSGSEDKGEYTVKYEDLVLFTGNEEILKGMPTNAGTKNGNVITMSSAYITQALTGKSKDKGKEYVAVIFYGNDEPGFLEQEDLQKIESLLDKDTDYKISSDKKVIVITESGFVKYSGASIVFVDTDITDAPLFNVSELTVAADKISWTEGTWLFKEIAEYSDGRKKFETDKIKADSSGIKYTEMISTQTGTVTESMPKAQFDMLIAAGKIKGNQYTYTIKTSEDDIAKENERIVGSFNYSISDLKTNADKTKFYWEATKTDKDNVTYTKKYYLEKKSGTSTPVILPESDSSSHSDGPTSPATPTPDTNISFTGKFQGTVSGYTSGSYVTYNIYIESTNKADYDVTLYGTGLEFKDKGTIVSKDETPTRTEYQGKGTGHSLFITTYEEGEMEVAIVLTSGLNYKGPITTPKSSEENKPDTGGDTVSNDKDESATLPEGIEANKEYTVTVLGQAKQMDGYAFAMMVALYNLDKDDYTVSGTNITITESGASKVFKLLDGYYAIVYGGESIFAMAEEELEDFAKSANLQESDYTRDDEAKEIILTAEGYEKAMSFMGKTGGIQSL